MDKPYRWTLRVSFDTLKDQEKYDRELAFPHDEVSLFISYLSTSWAIPPEALNDFVIWEPTKVTVHAEILDDLHDALGWLSIHTIPKHILVKRNEDR